ncbi:S8/S53 family peptidase [Pseudotabrizicola sediminis]|nr:S8/S53 family peptidase [Pseudotabrizicola sediminis]
MKKYKTYRTLVCLAVLSGCGGGDDANSIAKTIGAYYSWMSSEIQEAWASDYFGQGTRITIVDAFRESISNKPFSGNLGDGEKLQLHGEWVSDQIAMLAPLSSQNLHDLSNNQAVSLEAGKLNIINLSYGMIGEPDVNGNPYEDLNWSKREQSIIDYASNNLALVVKAAGNDGVAIDEINQSGNFEYLNLDLIGAQAAIFVGALNAHGTIDNPAKLANYSNYAGDNVVAQDQFIVVGVTGNITDLYGTSFAAPIISGYAAVLGSKFTSASPDIIKSRLLETARTDTIAGYNKGIHGKGEASLSRALAPDSID